MTDYVIDASAAAPFLFADEAGRLSSDNRALIAASSLRAPDHWPLETANMILMASRRRRIGEDDIALCTAILEKFEVKIVPLSAQEAWSSTMDLARSTGLTVYDAAYLDLALKSGAGLLTFHDALAAAARTRGVRTPLMP